MKDASQARAESWKPSTRKGLRILVPIDFSPCSQEALGQAVKTAVFQHGSITLLTVIDLDYHTPPTGPADWKRIEQELIEEAKINLAQLKTFYSHWVTIDSAIERGFAFEVIPNYARERRFDLIVIGKKPHRWWQRLFARHTVERVLEGSGCEVRAITQQTASHISEARPSPDFDSLNHSGLKQRN